MDTRDVAVRVAMKLFDERDVRELVLRRMQSVVQSGAIDTSSEKVLVSKVLLSEALQHVSELFLPIAPEAKEIAKNIRHF